MTFASVVATALLSISFAQAATVVLPSFSSVSIPRYHVFPVALHIYIAD